MPTSRMLKAGAAVATLLVGLLFAAPAFAQAHIRGTLTGAKDGVMTVQTVGGETKSIKLADKAPLFLVTKADMGAVEPGKFVGVTSVEEDGKQVAREVHVFAEIATRFSRGSLSLGFGRKDKHDDQRQYRENR